MDHTAGELAGLMAELKARRNALSDAAHSIRTAGLRACFETRSTEEFGQAEVSGDFLTKAASIMTERELINFRARLNGVGRAPTINDTLDVLRDLFNQRRVDCATAIQ